MRGGIEIKRLDVWALFKLGFAVYAIVGLVVALVYAGLLLLAGALGTAWIADEDLPSLGFGVFGGLLTVVLVPMLAFFYGAIAGVFIAIAGAVYNLAARVVGGVRFDIETFGPAIAAPAGAAPSAEREATSAGRDNASDAPVGDPPDRTE